MPEKRIRLYLPAAGEAVHVGHVFIHDDQLRLFLAGDLQGFKTITGGKDLHRRRGKKPLLQLQQKFYVINQKNLFHNNNPHNST